MRMRTDLWVSSWQKVRTDRRLYITRKGYLGLGPRSMQVGDEVWLICDAKVPFVLRPLPNDTKYSLMGESYLHGFMHGEMLKTDLRDGLGLVELV